MIYLVPRAVKELNKALSPSPKCNQTIDKNLSVVVKSSFYQLRMLTKLKAILKASRDQLHNISQIF